MRDSKTDLGRDDVDRRFYNTSKWERKREVILKRDGYQCRHCKRYGKIVPANTVHHIIPAAVRPELIYNNHNLLSLCTSCHEKMHDKFTDTLSKQGEFWVKKILQEHPEFI